MTCTLPADLCTYMITSHWILRKMRSISDQSRRKSQKHSLCLNVFNVKSFPLWDNAEKYYRNKQATDDNIMLRMRVACWIPKSTNTHSEYVILIVFFHCNNGRTNAHHCYGIRTVRVKYIEETYCVYCAVRAASLSVIGADICFCYGAGIAQSV